MWINLAIWLSRLQLNNLVKHIKLLYKDNKVVRWQINLYPEPILMEQFISRYSRQT